MKIASFVRMKSWCAKALVLFCWFGASDAVYAKINTPDDLAQLLSQLEKSDAIPSNDFYGKPFDGNIADLGLHALHYLDFYQSPWGEFRNRVQATIAKYPLTNYSVLRTYKNARLWLPPNRENEIAKLLHENIVPTAAAARQAEFVLSVIETNQEEPSAITFDALLSFATHKKALRLRLLAASTILNLAHSTGFDLMLYKPSIGQMIEGFLHDGERLQGRLRKRAPEGEGAEKQLHMQRGVNFLKKIVDLLEQYDRQNLLTQKMQDRFDKLKGRIDARADRLLKNMNDKSNAKRRLESIHEALAEYRYEPRFLVALAKVYEDGELPEGLAREIEVKLRIDLTNHLIRVLKGSTDTLRGSNVFSLCATMIEALSEKSKPKN